MFEFPDIENFTLEELQDEYRGLHDRFQEMRELSEADTQKIHELKRSLDTATSAQAYLSQELEQYICSDNSKLENELQKAKTELLQMKNKYEELQDAFLKLEHENSRLLGENSKISKYVDKSIKCKEQHVSDVDNKMEDCLIHIEILENENTEFLEKMEDLEDRSVHDTRRIAESEKTIEVLRDQILCLEENLQSKRIDLDEKLQIIESTQEQLADANAKIASLSTAPANERKGNSLFAEVDDQRQAMKQLLTAQKKSYLEMKKIYNEREDEVRRLKRENISMHTELNACSKIFCNADSVYQEKLHDRISNLMNQIEYLECKLKWTRERLKELAEDRGVLFLNSMLNYCKRETDDLKGQLYSIRIQKASLEEQLRNTQQDMARWRFESLKSRCLLSDRENLLTENKIAFKPANALEYNISEKEQEKAKPRIIPSRRSSFLEYITGRKSTTPSRDPTKQEPGSSEQSAKDTLIPNKQKEQLEKQINTNVDPTDISNKNEKKRSENEVVPHDQINSTTSSNMSLSEASENKEIIHENVYNNTSTNSIDDNPKLNKFSKLKAERPSPMRPSQKSLKKSTPKTSTPQVRSILAELGDSLFKVSDKNVRFSSDGDTVHNLSADPQYPTCSTSDANSTKSNVSGKNIAKPSSKSNIVVRRVVVSSKRK